MLYFYKYFSLKTITSSFTTLNNLHFSHFFTLFCIIFSFFSSDFLQNLISAIGILTFGILHGANDLKILAKKNIYSNSFLALPLWLVYIGIVFLGLFVFYFIPAIALLIFVLVSCYHFGEQHLVKKTKLKKLKYLFFTSYGVIIFSLLFIFNIESVNKVIFQIASIQVPYHLFVFSLITSSSVFLSFFIIDKSFVKNLFLEIALLFFLGIIFNTGTLLFGFGFYFVIWHSLPSLSSQIKFLYQDETYNPYIKYLKQAFFYWILAIAGLFGFYVLQIVPHEQYLSIFFSFLAGITFPHVIVMGLMFNSNKSVT